MFKIDSPSDYDYSELGLNKKTIRIPNSQFIEQRRSKTMKRAQYKSSKIIQYFQEKNPNYFQKMYRQIKKKTKLKQATTLRQKVTHQLLQDEKQNYKLKNNLETIVLNQNIQIIYSFLQILFIIFASIVTTISTAFKNFGNLNQVGLISLTISLFSMINILFRFFVRSSVDVQNISKPSYFVKQAIVRCLDFYLLLDMATMFIFFIDYLRAAQQIHFPKLIIILKLYPAIKKITNLQIIIITNCFREQYWALIKVFLSNFLFAHFIAIILISMANIQGNWLQEKGLMNSSWYQQYVWSYYWATTIMLTVGFGDIVPQNSQQAFVMIFIESLSCMVLAYNINSIGSIIKKITSYEQQKVFNFKIFTQMQGRQKISEDIKKKVTNYIIQSAQLKRNFNIQQQKQLLAKLPKTFYDQFKQQSSLHIFSSLHFFQNLNFQKLKELALKFQKRLTHPEQIIVESGSVPNVCIINNGNIVYSLHRIGTSSHGKQVQTFKVSQNQYKILSLYFFINIQVNYDMKCKDFAIVYSLKRQELEAIISTSRSSYEYFCMIKDKDRYNPNDWQVQKCQLCENKTHHTIFMCPKLHYIPIKQLIVAKALKNTPQKIKIIFSRQRLIENLFFKPRYKFSSLKIRKSVQKGYGQFLALSIVKCPTKSSNKRKKALEKLILQEKKQISKKQRNYFDTSGFQMNSNLENIFNEVKKQLKDQIMNTAYFDLLPNHQKHLQVDVAHDYASYFHKFNPSMLETRLGR